MSEDSIPAGKLSTHKFQPWPMLTKLPTLSTTLCTSVSRPKNTLHSRNATCLPNGSYPDIEPEREWTVSRGQVRCITKATGNHSWIKRNAFTSSSHSSTSEQKPRRHLLTRKSVLLHSIPAVKLSRHKLQLEAGKLNEHKPTTRYHPWPMFIKPPALSIIPHTLAIQPKNTLHSRNATSLLDSNPVIELERERPDSRGQVECMTKTTGIHLWSKRNALSRSFHTSTSVQEPNRHLLIRKNMFEDPIPARKLNIDTSFNSRQRSRMNTSLRQGTTHGPC
eukprot:3720201-Pleurochrysis_carterae.AAC.1